MTVYLVVKLTAYNAKLFLKFKKGDKLNLNELKALNRGLHYNLSKAEENSSAAALIKEQIDEVQSEIDYWTEIEKLHPFASFIRYS